MSFIYKISNIVNSKLYVGCTKTTIERRWKDHVSHGKSYPRASDVWTCTALYQAMHELGVDNFSVSCLEECPDELMLKRERYWIRTLSTLAPHGYNLALRKLTDQQAAIIRFNAYNLTQKEYAKLFGISLSTVQLIRTGRGKYYSSDPYAHLTREDLP